MRTVVVLAVIGVCTASYQASSYGRAGSYNYVQPRWTGPVAATVPAGVGGNIIQVPDTPEVAAARSNFFRAYQDQLSKINSLSYSTPNSGPSYISGEPVHAPAASVHVPAPASVPAYPSFAAPAAPNVPVSDTPEVAAAKADFFRTYERQAAEAAAAPDDYYAPAPAPAVPVHKSHGAPVISYGAPAVSDGAPAPFYGAPAPSYNSLAPVYSAPAAPNVPVTDAPEVAAAKADFFRTYNKLAAEAAAAPDIYTNYH